MDSRFRAFITLVALVAMVCGTPTLAQNVSSTWVADQGDGTYRNPIIHADYSDPDLCRVGKDYYMTASSFQCTPGLPILHSRDLVNWRIVNYALPRLVPTDFYATPQHGKGVWAPSIRYHKGVCYIYWGDPDFGIYMVRTRNPLGLWEEPVLVKAGKGMIDPTPLWDDDGRVYLVHAWAGSRAGFNSVLTVCELSADGTSVVGDEVMVFDGYDGINHTVEGPKLYKRNGYYYIFTPAGGVATGWQLVLRSRHIYGPYDKRIVMAQGNSDVNGPHQGGWVDTPKGESWFLHFQDKGLYGRVLHLNPMRWVDDWPVIGSVAEDESTLASGRTDDSKPSCGTPVMTYRKPDVGRTYPMASPQESDEFDTCELGLQWEWHANRQSTFGFPTRQGYFRLYGHQLSESFVNMWEVPNLLLQKFPAPSFTATTKVKIAAKANAFGVRSGLVVMGYDYSALVVENTEGGFCLKQATCHDADQGAKEESVVLADLPAHRYEAGAIANKDVDVYLRVKVDEGGLCHFSYSTDGRRYTPAGHAFKARQGKWIGAKVGFCSTTPHGKDRGWMDIDWFRMER